MSNHTTNLTDPRGWSHKWVDFERALWEEMTRVTDLSSLRTSGVLQLWVKIHSFGRGMPG